MFENDIKFNVIKFIVMKVIFKLCKFVGIFEYFIFLVKFVRVIIVSI